MLFALQSCSVDAGTDLDEAHPAALSAAGPAGAMRGYIVVLDRAQVSRARVGDVANHLAGSHGGQLGWVYRDALRGFSATLPEAAVAALARDPRVRYIEEDQRVSIGGNEVPTTWGLDRIDQRDLPLGNDFGWGASGRGVNLYVIDTGVHVTHRELTGRAVHAATFVTNDPFGADDCNGHGTHVAATAAGSVSGVAKSASVHSVRVLGCDGSGQLAAMIAGVDWVTANSIKPAVANMSLYALSGDALDEAVRESIATGVVYAVAAANFEQDACRYSPARTAEALTVAASDAADANAWFTNWGPCVDLFAPGVSISSASKNSDDAYTNLSGTSMASPHVAGAAAQYLEQFPQATPAQVGAAILANATPGRLQLTFPDEPGASETPNLMLYTPFIVASTDETPPTVSITTPSAGATITGPATVTVTAADNVEVTRVELYANGLLAGSSTTAPFDVAWNSYRTPGGTTSLVARAFDSSGNRVESAAVSVSVVNPTQALYDSNRRAPACTTATHQCDTFALLDGRGPLGPEPHASNTINGSCSDGTTGTYHVEESVDRMRVVSVDGTNLAPGKTVRFEIEVWTRASFINDLYLFHASNALSPQWVNITGSVILPVRYGRQHAIGTRELVLPAGNLQAVRAVLVPSGTNLSPCPSNAYTDIDDLVFTTGGGGGQCIPSGGGLPCTSTTQCCAGVGACTGGKPASRTCL